MSAPITNNKFSLFLSYSSKDVEMAMALADALSSRGISVIYDKNTLNHGENWKEILTDSLITAEGFLVLLTPNSLSSEYVMNEIGMARAFDSKLFLPVVYRDTKIPSFISDLYAIYWNDDFEDVVSRIEIAIGTHKIKIPDEVNDNVNNNPSPVESDTEVEKVYGRNHWLLKMDPNNWIIEDFSEGTETYFNTHYTNGEERPENKFFDIISVGDYVLGYSSGTIQGITCLMKIKTTVVQDDPNTGRRFKMIVEKKYNPIIPFSTFKNIYEKVAAEHKNKQKPGQLFYQISGAEFEKITSYIPEDESDISRSLRPYFLTEGNHEATEDQLEFESDINSFASVIALKSVMPPLAIGLFGNWGSGKSFFMDKLEDKINDITHNGDGEYIKNVVQVRFNSWHYSDTNLWASLTTQIFESLHDYATKKEYGAKAIEAIYKDLNITSYQLEETKRKIESNSTQAALLEERKIEIEKTIELKKERLTIWESGDLLKIVFSDPFIQNDLKAIQSEFNEEGITENLGVIKNKLSEIDTIGSQLYESVILLKQKGNWKWIWIWAVVVAVIGYLVLGPFKETIETIINGGTIVTGLVVTWLSNFMYRLAPYFKKIRNFYTRLKSLKDTVEREKEKAQIKEQGEINRLNNDIQTLLAEKEQLEISQQNAEDKKLKLELELKEIGSGKLLSHFLEGRTTDDAYIKQLGIVSWIRKDFAKLDELFQKQKTVQNKESDLKTEVQIDRIVLYIDDLDRCNEDIVVKVLEAIHLLLAFELFVVVVGVDPRWLNNALSEKYKNLFGQPTKTSNNSENSDSTLNGVATSYDYLEKIFQIPFALKPINKTGREKLIGYLVREEMEQVNSVEPIIVPSTDQSTASISIEKEETIVVSKEEPVSEGNNVNDKKLTQPPPTTEVQRLIFTNDEIIYMQKISSLFGHTPRTINRYVNIYRIIKAHKNLKVSADYTKKDFMPIMYLLAIIVGHSVHAKSFLTEINKADSTELLADFIARLKFNEHFKTILESTSEEIKNYSVKDFSKNSELIARFSFRTLIVEN